MPSWPAVAVGLLAPLALVLVTPFVRLREKPSVIAIDFTTGAILTFAALLIEGFSFSYFGSFVPTHYRVLTEAFVFVALIEETIKIAQVVQLSERRKIRTLPETISIALVVAAGFAGAENVVYLFRYTNDISNLLLLRTLTAIPMHLAVAVVSARFIFIARQNSAQSHYYAIALLVATVIHGLYDYLIIASRGRSFAFMLVLGFVIAWAWRIMSAQSPSAAA